jgi:hypothetical protein
MKKKNSRLHKPKQGQSSKCIIKLSSLVIVSAGVRNSGEKLISDIVDTDR